MALRGVRVVRLSVLTDETTSPERQRGSTDYAAALEGIEFDGREAVDLGVSASKIAPMERPELGAWLRRPDDFDALVAWRFDRLIRSMVDMNDMSKWAAEHRKVIVFAEGPGGKLTLDFRNPLDPVAQLMLTVFAFAAQMEAMSIQERVRGAQAALRTMPYRWRGSRPPYGYKPEPMPAEFGGIGWTLIPDPAAGEVIARILKELRRKRSPTAIAEGLTADGVASPRDHWGASKGRKPGGKAGKGQREVFAWSAQAIVQIVTSEAMLGWKMHQGNPVRDATGAPVMSTANPLMTRSEFDEIGALLNARSVPGLQGERKDTNALLAGVLLCAGCGGAMYLSKLGTRPATYKCGFRSRRTPCKAPSAVKVEWADGYAAETFLAALGPLEIVETRIIPGYDPKPEHDATLAEFVEHQEQKGRQKSAAAKDAWQRRADSLDARLAELESREAVPERTESVGIGVTYADKWESSDDAAKRQMMRSAGFTITCAKGTSGGWRTLDTSRMTWDISNAFLSMAADEHLAAASAEMGEV
ncbi:recombinase family protein [Streptomyces mirabilis]|uniref:recombinase family protein n=1 Tax=Streptomyces mirabilis TaxID=68239 RepID=UPI0036AA64AF